jgi:hypothetical protein
MMQPHALIERKIGRIAGLGRCELGIKVSASVGQPVRRQFPPHIIGPVGERRAGVDVQDLEMRDLGSAVLHVDGDPIAVGGRREIRDGRRSLAAGRRSRVHERPFASVMIAHHEHALAATLQP